VTDNKATIIWSWRK